MKLFGDFEAVYFPEEHRIFVTHDRYLYYIFDQRYGRWEKYRNAGYDAISVSNYPDVSREELTAAMGGVFPKKETDFMRHCLPQELCIRDMLDLYREDYPRYIGNWEIYHSVHRFLLESDIPHKTYLSIRKLFDEAMGAVSGSERVLIQIKELSCEILGRDIFKKEIGIDDGHNGSSYFWIMPVRVIDYTDTENLESVAEMKSAEISIEEDDVAQYLTPFLYRYFDDGLEANQKREYEEWLDDDGTVKSYHVSGFEWYLTHNFYTYEAIEKILRDIRDTAEALAAGKENNYTAELKIKRGLAAAELLYAKDLSPEQIAAYNVARPKEDDTEAGLIIDFYRRFLYRMEYMMKVGREKGYDLISFMGP